MIELRRKPHLSGGATDGNSAACHAAGSRVGCRPRPGRQENTLGKTVFLLPSRSLCSDASSHPARAGKAGRPLLRFPAKPSPPRRDQLPAAKDRLWRRNRELTVLNAVASAASRHLELKTVLYVTLKETLALMRVGGGIIYLYDKASRRLSPAAHRGVSAALLRELLGLRLGESFSGAVAASRKPLVIPDFRKDARTPRIAVRPPRPLRVRRRADPLQEKSPRRVRPPGSPEGSLHERGCRPARPHREPGRRGHRERPAV